MVDLFFSSKSRFIGVTSWPALSVENSKIPWPVITVECDCNNQWLEAVHLFSNVKELYFYITSCVQYKAYTHQIQTLRYIVILDGHLRNFLYLIDHWIWNGTFWSIFLLCRAIEIWDNNEFSVQHQLVHPKESGN